LLLFFGYVISVIYSFWLYNRVCFGSSTNVYNSFYIDLSEDEFFYLFVLSIFVILMGIFPNYIMGLLNSSIFSYCLQFNF